MKEDHYDWILQEVCYVRHTAVRLVTTNIEAMGKKIYFSLIRMIFVYF